MKLLRLPKTATTGYLRNVLILLSGTTIAQAIPMVASVVLTRLFTPSDFGLLGVFSAILAVTSVAISLRYEHAIVIEANESGARAVAQSSVVITVGISLLLLLILSLARGVIARWLHNPALADALWLLPPTLFATGIVQIWSLWLLRHQRFAQIARIRIVQSLTITAVGVGAGLLAARGFYLVSASLAGPVVCTLWLWAREGRELPGLFLGLPDFRAVTAKFRRFPLFTVPADLLSAGAAQLPMLFLGAGYGAAIAGAFLLTQRILGAPLTIVGSAVMDAYKRDAAMSYAEHGSCRALAVRTARHLAMLSAIPWLLAITISPTAFRLAFGANWATAGVLCQILATPLFLRFVTTPISYNFYLAGRQSEDLIAQIYNLGSNALILWLAARADFSPIHAIAFYAVNMTFVYAFYLWRSLNLAERPVPSS